MEYKSFVYPYKHGFSNSRIYSIWKAMRKRCRNSAASNFRYYGGRGISVCDRWSKFENFYDDMAKTYEDGLTIDRIDVNGDYSPENCRWATMQQQCQNKNSCIYLEHGGIRLTIKQWADKIGLNYYTLVNRISRYGWTVERALTEKVNFL